jgi:hypothetical protein
VTRSATRAYLGFGAFITLVGGVACGDVTSDLITGSPGATTAGSPPGGGSAGGTAPGGAGGSSPGGAGSPASGGTASGGASAGSGGTPDCTTNSDCTDSERRFCHPTRRLCVECTDEGQCASNEDCSAEIGECARPCTSSAECLVDDDDRICDTLIGFCVECVGDADCPSNRCSTWKCDT